MQPSSTKFSNLQLELLKLYSTNLSENQLIEVKLVLGQYFAQKATEGMDEIWENQKLTSDDMINWTNEHNRH
ncbi:MAG: hypothetical protein WCH34_10985 [Bacteroidota bacterium]